MPLWGVWPISFPLLLCSPASTTARTCCPPAPLSTSPLRLLPDFSASYHMQYHTEHKCSNLWILPNPGFCLTVCPSTPQRGLTTANPNLALEIPVDPPIPGVLLAELDSGKFFPLTGTNFFTPTPAKVTI